MKNKPLVIAAVVAALVVAALLVWRLGFAPSTDEFHRAPSEPGADRQQNAPEDSGLFGRLKGFAEDLFGMERDKGPKAPEELSAALRKPEPGPAPRPPAQEPLAQAEPSQVRQPVVGNETAPAQVEQAAPAEDRVVGLGFVDDMARFMAEAYFPAGSHPDAARKGITLLSAKALNMRYGTEMVGLAHENQDLLKAREEVFDYVLQPDVLGLLHDIYADALAERLAFHAARSERTFRLKDKKLDRALNPGEMQELFTLTGSWLKGLGDTLSGLAAMDRMNAQVQGYLNTVQATLDANADFIAALGRYQELNQALGPTPSQQAKAEAEAARRGMEKVGDAYQKAIAAREQGRQKLLDRIRSSGKSTLGDADRLYVAQWVHRRTEARPERMAAVVRAGELLRDLAEMLFSRAEQGFAKTE